MLKNEPPFVKYSCANMRNSKWLRISMGGDMRGSQFQMTEWLNSRIDEFHA